jgi:hypothetical protein
MFAICQCKKRAQHATRTVIRHVKSAIATYRYSHRVSPDLSIRSDKSREEVFIFSRSFSSLHWNANDFVTAAIRTVSKSMFGRDSVTVILD